MDNPAINVNSEIGKLKTVLLKSPGAEVENITPNTMERLLFDDIPFLKIAQKEHDYFAETLRKMVLKYCILMILELRHSQKMTILKNRILTNIVMA